MFSQRQWDELSAFAASFASPGGQQQQQPQQHGDGQSQTSHGGNQHSFYQQQPPQQSHFHQDQQLYQPQQQQQQPLIHQSQEQEQQQFHYGAPQQPSWSRFGSNTTPTPTQDMPYGNNGLDRNFELSNSGQMDWTSSSDFDSGIQHHAFGVHQNEGMRSGNVDFGTPQSSEGDDQAHSDGHRRGGVGRLVAQFENKNFSPPLPPRPTSNAIASPIAINQQYQAHTQPTEPQPPSSPFGFEPSHSTNSFTSNSFHSNNRFDSPSDSQFGSFGTSYSRMASPIATSPGPIAFGNFHDASRVASPASGPTSDPFASLDFMATSRMAASFSHTPMIGSPAPVTPASSAPGGTPGFAIWRPPGQQVNQEFHQQAQQRAAPNLHLHAHAPPKPYQHDQHSHEQALGDQRFGNTTNSHGHARPPVPSTPKPAINAGNQFILELNPGAKPKGKSSVKPPKPRAPKPSNLSLNPIIKEEPSTPTMPEIATPSSTSHIDPMDATTSHPSNGSRPSREQVPAQAWEGFKSTIRDLYLEQRKPLKEVMSIMADKYNFQATPKMYKTRFSQWGFVKNNTEDEVKRLLSMKFQRDAEGKVSEFVRNGKIVDLGTYLKRKGVTEYDLVDFEVPVDLPSHIRCRTPTPPPAPEYLKSPDLLRAQELVVSNMRKAFLQCRQVELEMERHVSWSSMMVWGAPSSELLTEANFFFEAGDVDQGGTSLMNAFNQLEVDLKQLSPQGIIEVMLGMVRRDPGLMTALGKYVAAFSTTNYDRSHPLRQIFTCLYEVQQKHGAVTLSDLLWGSTPQIADELEAMYGHRHPYVARTWIDLALVYEHKNMERLEKLVLELRILHRQMEQQQDAEQADLISLRCAIAQILYAMDPASDAAKQAANDLWKDMKKMKTVFRVRDSRPHTYCYHCPVKVDPWTKRCRRRYDSEVELLEKLVEVKILPYFEEDFHTAQHELDSHDAWAAAMSQPISQNRWGFI